MTDKKVRARLERDLHDYADTLRSTADTVDKLATQIGEDEMSIKTAREIVVNKQEWDLVRIFDQT